MLWLTLGLALVVAVAAIFYVVRPLLEPGRRTVSDEEDDLARLIQDKDAVLREIKEVEFDFQTGKTTEQDFMRDNDRLRRRAVGLLRRIERLAPDAAALDAALEAEILARRKTADPIPVEAPAAPEPAVQEQAVQEPAEDRFCFQCGAVIRAEHNFCPKCGVALKEARVG